MNEDDEDDEEYCEECGRELTHFMVERGLHDLVEVWGCPDCDGDT